MELTKRYWIAKLGLIGLLLLGTLGCFCGSCAEGTALKGAGSELVEEGVEELFF